LNLTALGEVLGEGLGLVDRLLLALGVVGVVHGRRRVAGRLATAEALAAHRDGDLRRVRERGHEGRREGDGSEKHDSTVASSACRDSHGTPSRQKPHPLHLQREQWVEHLGYVSLFPLMLRLLPVDSPQLPHLLELLADPDKLWTPYGIRSLAADDRMHGRPNAPGDEPYWRGPIWINLNYLLLSGLHHYANTEGQARARAAELYTALRSNLVENMQREWERTGYLWEQYSPETGLGQRNHPFNGWSGLVLLMVAEKYD